MTIVVSGQVMSNIRADEGEIEAVNSARENASLHHSIKPIAICMIACPLAGTTG
ncbi:hypothetical protein [Embleya scabrispora]|uniref:hypothetical protein n=1 Tax=Embleya scabrispora TaxID=159449 RepID=UPI001374D066|nr:hypothetical protein [Embleya scabrispora]